MRLSGLNPQSVKRIRVLTLWMFFVSLLYVSFKNIHVDLEGLINGIPYGISLVGEMFPPNFSGWRKILFLTAETIAMGFWGTLLGILISLPLGFFAAKNTSPHAIVFNLIKILIDFFRSIPEILYAVIFVISLGMGPLAGVMALMVGTVGMLSKFYAESIESIDPKPVEAVRATGGHSLSVIRHAVFPQVFPLFMAYNLYMLDHNIRVAMAIGIVGAGGLGVELFTQMRRFQYSKVSAILIIILLLVTVIDRLSAYLRKGITDGTLLEGKQRRKEMLLLAVLSTIAISSIYFIPISFKELYRGLPVIYTFISDAFPPDLSQMDLYMKLMFETFAIGICGTLFAIVLSVPLGFLSAGNIAHNWFIYNGAKEIINFFRAMPELVFALIFVAVVGLGPFAGVLAISFHTAGFLGKFYAEAVENLDPGPVEATEATGARFPQVIRHTIFPMVLPLFNSYNLYLLDRNIRASTVMGIVGAGGIGFELIMSTRLFEYEKTASIIGVILVTIMVVDHVSTYLRKKVV